MKLLEPSRGPRPLGAVIDDVFRVYAAVLPQAMVPAALGALLGGILLSMAVAEMPQSVQPADVDWAALAPGWLVQLVVSSVVQGMLLAMVAARARDGVVMPTADALRAGIACAPAMIGATLVYLVLSVLLTFLLIVPGIWMLVAGLLYAPAVALEGAPALAAVGRSRELVRGAWWRTFGLLLLVFVIAGVGYLMIATFVTPLARAALGGGWPVELALATVVGGLFAPLMNSLLVVLYHDRVQAGGDAPAAPPPTTLAA